MGILELKNAVRTLPPGELSEFSAWLEELVADHWDAEFEADALGGKLDELGKAADADFEAGRCREL